MALTPLGPRLQGKRVVLASASPRRRDILRLTGVPFDVVPSHFLESLPKSSFPAPPDYVLETAKQKALEVASRLRGDPRPPDVVIGADTVVVLDGRILEKPKDKDDAIAMLRSLSGHQHSIITGVAVVRPRRGPASSDPEVTLFHEETRVTFSPLSEPLLREYVECGEPMDKAGAYGLQGVGAMLAERVEGDFLSAVGFPLNRFLREAVALFPEVTSETSGAESS
ncbi:probable bifunctional dTTP/UTP pyrophosphatase/methyltransferase protein [Cricetulus griseus]|uniref:Probable bifunctional dTTP/UTP pyrophosphatase/methyltransferase protein n=1 Tax=Cricetulus griseus TaxID=10029 RepID=A0A9J7GMC8_CRIGR|nr:probable bifunctional dTTP/UTP pyrophosphatase/methyltransferase protein [Cricetulus griseus]XP_027289965.1 probable bifunctional dTTP/UTP pyrophosphatase/methyltransferase protein [Cricetulus griseus]XP_027289966.1 probable bifunctional dTTP/UTP pyrophosphatase/methyltransferase protein [Cricetulus griseus]